MNTQRTISRRRARTILGVLLGAAIGNAAPPPAGAARGARLRSSRTGMSVRLVQPRYDIPEKEKRGRDELGRDRAEMWRYRQGLQRRGIADLDPYGDPCLRFRATNYRSVPVTVRFSGIEQPRHSPGHLTVVSVRPGSVRLAPKGRQDIVVHVASKREVGGTATFRFLASTADHIPEVASCRVRYEFDSFSE